MMENLEIEEEEDREREAENDEVQEVPVTRKPSVLKKLRTETRASERRASEQPPSLA